MFITHKNCPMVRGRLWHRAIIGAIVCLGLGTPALSAAQGLTALNDPPDLPSVSLHGFGTLGLTRSNDDNAEFVRDLSQPNGAGTRWTPKVDSLVGLQANVHFSHSTEAVVQVVSRYHADSSYRPELTWAFVRHDFSPDFSLRAGRLGTEFYMLGDSRLVGYSNLSLRPPPDFYGSLVFSYIDGLDVTLTRPVASGLLKAKLFAGRSPEKTPYAPGLTWDLSGSTLVGGYLDYQHGPWQLRASHAQVQFHHEMPVNALTGQPYLSAVPAMAMAGQSVRFNSLGLVYDQGPLNVQLMLNQIKHDGLAYADSKAGYVMAAYRLGAITPYLGVSRSSSDVEQLPVIGDVFIDKVLTPSLVAQSVSDQHTYTVGARWDFQKNLAVKAQVDRINGTPSSVFLLKGTESGGWDGKMTVFSLALDFVF